MPKKPEVVAEVEGDDAEAKRLKKLAKRAAKEAAATEQEEPAEVDEAEAKRQRKAAKKAAKEAAVAEQEEAPAEIDEAEAKRQRKAAKKAAKEAAVAETVEVVTEEVDEAEAKRQRKAAKKAAKEAAAKAVEEPEEKEAVVNDTKAKKDKRKETDEDDEEAPKAKKSKTEEPVVAEEEKAQDCKGKSKGKGKEGGHDNTNTVFVRGLPFSATEDALKKDFSECGEIESFKLPLNEESKPKGICFIKFATESGVEAALKFDNTDYGGRTIFVSKAGEGGKGKDGKGKDGKSKGGKGKDGKGVVDNENTVFVGGLPFSVTEDALKKDFAECGEIESLRLPLNEEGKPKGISFIKFKTEAAVEAALKFDSTDYGGRTINVRKAGEGGKGKGKDGKDGKGKGKDGKGKGKKGKGKASSEAKAKNTGAMVESTGEKKTFEDSDDE